MLHALKQGFRTSTSEYFLLLVLWMYQFAWGLALLGLVKSIVVPLMHRYPGSHLNESAVQLFLAEGQFQLVKTDISHSFLWLLLGMTLLRMLITPMINAGIFYSIHNGHLNPGYRFVKGMKELGGPFLGYYVLQIALTLLPAYWLLPVVRGALATQASYEGLALELLPWAAGYALYGGFVHLLFLYLLLGRTTGATPLRALGFLAGRLPGTASIALTLALLSGASTVLTLTASLWWAGISALILHQLFHLIKLLFKLWAVSAQYHYYQSQ